MSEGNKHTYTAYIHSFPLIRLKLAAYPKQPSGNDSFDFQPISYSQNMMVGCIFLTILGQTSVCMMTRLGRILWRIYWENRLHDFPSPSTLLPPQCLLPGRIQVHKRHMWGSHLQCYTQTHMHTCCMYCTHTCVVICMDTHTEAAGQTRAVAGGVAWSHVWLKDVWKHTWIC